MKTYLALITLLLFGCLKEETNSLPDIHRVTINNMNSDLTIRVYVEPLQGHEAKVPTPFIFIDTIPPKSISETLLVESGRRYEFNVYWPTPNEPGSIVSEKNKWIGFQREYKKGDPKKIQISILNDFIDYGI